MKVSVQKRQNLWLALLLLVLCSNLTLYRTDFGKSILETGPSSVALGSLIDLVIVAPILVLAWKREKSIKLFLLLSASGLVLSRILIPIEYLKPYVAITWVGIAVELGLLAIELLLLVTLVRYLPKIIKDTKNSSLPILFSFTNAVDRYVQKHQLIHIVCSEMLMFYYALASWRKKPTLNENTVTLHKNSSYIAFQVMLIHAVVIETLGIHWFIHEKSMILSIILLVLNIYTVIFFLADIRVVQLNPVLFTKEKMYISLGLMKRMEISWADIHEVITEQEELKQKLTKDTIDFLAKDFDEVTPNVILKLKQPIEATLALGLKKSYEKVAIKFDDLQRFIDAYNKYKS
ncbi:beta-carotene 15,15'-monooxygenase [Ureibacillus endophyticus]|uniref:Beta-carotene 15,15'-monooxygenase n=1 Tax=Ureibacillus endophyticus TaxID=1978490 RepID=A0A494YUM9_9BACL|nr:beta-carotene 15,15'-monooxygenase [Lysinibacillus endophyticus]RKQ13771.1 beta-carotene 15,15'-monooxygenase [Lysinibacillus endophyticus]